MGAAIPQNNSISTSLGDGRIDTGFQMDLSGDYYIQPWLSVGGELGFNWNSVSGTQQPFSPGGFWYYYPPFWYYQPYYIEYHDPSLFQMPMMVNVTFHWPNQSYVTPFVGVGAGGNLSVLSSGWSYDDYYYSYYYYSPADSDVDFTYALQAFAGARVQLSEKMSLGLIYRYRYMGNQDWAIDTSPWVGIDQSFSKKHAMFHSICLEISARF